MIDQSKLYREVRNFALTSPPFLTNRITYQTLPDERFDVTLVSQRVYGNREEGIVIMAAAGLDSSSQELTERVLVLPDAATLLSIKQSVGFASGALAKVR